MKIEWKPYGNDRELTGEIKTGTYQVHSADRMEGQNTGKFVAAYWPNDDYPNSEIEGYLAVIDGTVKVVCGNGYFNACGVPDIAEYATPEAAMKICELHFSQKGN